MRGDGWRRDCWRAKLRLDLWRCVFVKQLCFVKLKNKYIIKYYHYKGKKLDKRQKKKSSKQERATQLILLLTAILNLVLSVVNLIDKLIE